MKIIDLLNKIARNEKISVNCRYFDIDFYDIKNFHISYSNIVKDGLTLGDLIRILNEEVEILEEEKKMPEKLDDFDIQGLEVSGYSMTQAEYLLEDGVKENREMINWILDYLKSKGDE